MPEPEENLEEIIRRPYAEPAPVGPERLSGFAGRCECGTQITPADLYGERGEVDLGRPRRRPAARFLQYRCPLCGRTGELRVES